MIRRTVLFCALVTTISLAACDSKHEDASADAASAHVEATVEAPALPEPALDVWKTIGPLLTGSYRGTCLRLPDGGKVDATIAFSADGKVDSGDLHGDFRSAKEVLLSRVRDAGGQYATTATAFNAGDKSGAFSLGAGQGGRVGNVSFGSGDITLQCSDVAGVARLNTGPLYQVVAPIVNMKKQVLACLDTKTMMSSKDIGIALTDGVISIGEASYDIRKSSNEMLNFSNDGKSLLMTIQMPDTQTVGLGWDGAGQLTMATVLSKDGTSASCSKKN